MTAETLRRAANLMRERASLSAAGPWGRASTPGNGFAVHRGEHETVALYCDRDNAAHIASWHPAVALAVADVLDAVTCACTPCSCCGVRVTCDGCEPVEAALNLARLYLGDAS